MRSLPSLASQRQDVEFNRTKYGLELLVDCAWIREMPTFFRPVPHRLHFYEILLIERGGGRLALDGVSYDVRPGKVFFTSPGQIRTWSSTEVEGLCLFFPSVFLGTFFQDSLFVERLPYFHRRHPPELVLIAKDTKIIRNSLLMIRKELQRLRPDSEHLMRAKLYETLILLMRAYSSTCRAADYRSLHPTVSRFRHEIAQQRARLHNVTDYARKIGITAGHLNALCQTHLGQSAKAVIQDAIFIEARRALSFSQSRVEDIAYDLGFSDPSYFARFFRRHAGMPPAAFRKDLGQRGGAKAPMT